MRRLLAAALVGVTLLIAGCSSGEELSDEVIRQLEIPDRVIADLTGDGAEVVDDAQLIAAIGRARSLGTELRVVIAGRGEPLASASGVVDRFGGTALSYKAGTAAFEASSEDISTDQVERAIVNAAQQPSIGDSVTAFIDVIEFEGLEGGNDGLRSAIILALFLLSLVFLIWQMLRFRAAKKRRDRRKDAFDERRRSLQASGAQLARETEALRPVVAQQGIGSAAWAELDEYSSGLDERVAAAADASELDGIEMRLGRAFLHLRALQEDLKVR